MVWPSVFDQLKGQLEDLHSKYITISETREGPVDGSTCGRTLTCGLISKVDYENLEDGESLGHQVTSSDVYPIRSAGEYNPSFSIFCNLDGCSAVEPLVPSWTHNNKTVHQPDLALLMTYGLVPRLVPGSSRILWDEPAKLVREVAIVDPVSYYEPFAQSPGGVRILRDYLQDYASLRGMCVVCVFYERWLVKDSLEAKNLLKTSDYFEERTRKSYFRCQKIMGSSNEFHIDIWGHHLLLEPGPLPISSDDTSVDSLAWPGIELTPTKPRGYMWENVFINDGVLNRFEGQPEFSILPELGSVSFGNQWSVSHCRRVGRDIISVELRKLYEGLPAEIIRHYHSFAVDPKVAGVHKNLDEPHIGMRAKRIVFALLDLADAIDNIAKETLDATRSDKSAISLKRETLEYEGWWKNSSIEPICRHIPMDAKYGFFLDRCKKLQILVVETLTLSILRHILISLGDIENTVKTWKSLQCLSRLCSLCEFATIGGLRLVGDSKIIIADHPTGQSDWCKRLYALNAIRQLDAHQAGSAETEKLHRALNVFAIDPSSLPSGHGSAVDRIYDCVAQELEEAAKLIASS